MKMFIFSIWKGKERTEKSIAKPKKKSREKMLSTWNFFIFRDKKKFEGKMC